MCIVSDGKAHCSWIKVLLYTAHIACDANHCFINVFLSTATDHGATWKKAGTLYGIPYGAAKLSGDFIPDEPQVVELSDGSLLITARNQGHYHSRARFMIKSYDAADSLQLQNVYIDNTLLDSAVQVS